MVPVCLAYSRSMTAVSWVTAFLDLPPAVHEAGTRFWAAVTGYAVSPARGDDGEFTTLLPPVGDPYLKLQRTGAGGAEVTGPRGPPGLHLPTAPGPAARPGGAGGGGGA